MTIQPEARYQQVAAQLRRMILTGELAPGAKLPSEAALAEQYEVSRPMVNRAIHVLVAEGLVTISRGRGSFVREQRPILQMSTSYLTADAEGRRATWSTELARQGLSGGQRIVRAEIDEPDPEVSGHLLLSPGEHVIVRERLMMLGDHPVGIATSYYPASLAADTELSNAAIRLRGGTIAALERLGITLERFEDTLGARMPLPSEARTLRMEPGTAVFFQDRLTVDASGTPVEFSKAIMRADQNRVRYVLPARR